jgi:hypothetical protein
LQLQPIPETNHVSRVYNVAAVLQLQFMVHVMLFPTINVLYFYISSFRSKCAVPSVAVFLISCLRAFFVYVFPQFFSSSTILGKSIITQIHRYLSYFTEHCDPVFLFHKFLRLYSASSCGFTNMSCSLM